MRTRRLGRSGLSVSALGLGTMTWGSGVEPDVARDLLTTFVEAGGTLIDTASTYGAGVAEEALGEFLGEVVAREDVVLTTKAGLDRRGGERVVDTSRRGLLRTLEASLRRLRTDHVDVWLVHAWSEDTPLEETIATLEHVQRSGQARYVGVSNYGGWQVARAVSLAEQIGLTLVADEVELSLLSRRAEDEVLPAADALGFGVLAWSPLGRGILTGKYRGSVPPDSRAASRTFPGLLDRYLDERAALVTEAVVTAARGLRVSPAEVALAWVRERPGVASAIVGARNLGQLRTAIASDALDLPEPVVSALDEVSS